MSDELITDDGRIFKKDINGYTERTKNGYSGKPMNGREFKRNVLDANGQKVERLKDSAKTHPRYSAMMWEHATKYRK